MVPPQQQGKVQFNTTFISKNVRYRCPDYLLHMYILAMGISQSALMIQQKPCTVVIINQDCWRGRRSSLSRSGNSHTWTHISLNNENSTYWFPKEANNACNWFKCDPQHGGLSSESSAFLRNWPWLRLSSALELQDGWNLNCIVIARGIFFPSQHKNLWSIL